MIDKFVKSLLLLVVELDGIRTRFLEKAIKWVSDFSEFLNENSADVAQAYEKY